MKIKTITIQTNQRTEVIDIHNQVMQVIKQEIEEKNIKEGLVNVFTPHATAAIILNENYDDNVKKDITNFLNNIIPKAKWLHDQIDGNGDSHVKASIIGPSETIIINNSKPFLGTWQSFGLCEFDGPRERKIVIQVI